MVGWLRVKQLIGYEGNLSLIVLSLLFIVCWNHFDRVAIVADLQMDFLQDIWTQVLSSTKQERQPLVVCVRNVYVG